MHINHTSEQAVPQDLDNIKPGKATLLLVNEFGFILHRHITVTKVDSKNNDLVLHYRIKGERRLRGTCYRSDIAVYEGWVDISGTFNSAADSPVTCFEVFAENAIESAMLRVSVSPVFLQKR